MSFLSEIINQIVFSTDFETEFKQVSQKPNNWQKRFLRLKHKRTYKQRGVMMLIFRFKNILTFKWKVNFLGKLLISPNICVWYFQFRVMDRENKGDYE
jgi:hypothetical protein